jgi:uncharacterized protein (TIGR03382 family)
MNRSASLFALALASSLAFTSGFAFADEADKAACVDKSEGDECTRGDGDPGFCEVDESDDVLSCDDDGASSSSGGCSASATDPGSLTGLAGVIGALALVRRRRSRA